jgi:hypothetical protein
MITTTLGLLILIANQQPKLTFPARLQGLPGSFIVVKPIQIDGKSVKYFTPSPGLNLFPADLLSDKTATVATANLPGKYLVYGYTALGDIPSDPASIEIIIGDPGPTPFPPKPPAPNPPDPDPTPSPTDPLSEALEAIWGALDEPNKVQSKAKLAQVYRESAKVCKDPAFLTVGQAFSRSKEIGRATLPDSSLSSLRSRISEELRSVVPIDPSVILSAELRAKIASQLDRMANLVESLR